MTAALVVDGASVRFGSTAALDSVDLSVAAGEVLAVLGPSGSGKSTMLRAIAGLQPLDAGRVVLDGRDLAGIPPHRRGVGLMFQDHALFPHRDVAANVGFGLRMQGLPPVEVAARVAELLTMVDLAGFGGRRIFTLSGGEQQRVALARALAPRPALLLLDEPLGALDRLLRDRLVADLRGLFTRLGLTVVAVTHDQVEAFALADRVAVMDAGRVLQVGTPSELWERPASSRVARLLGFGNVVDVEVRMGRAITPWGEVSLPGAADGEAALVIRPNGVALDVAAGQEGASVGVVRAASFEGDRTALRVEVEGAPLLDALVRSDGAPRVGDRVRPRIDPAAVVRVDRAPPA